MPVHTIEVRGVHRKRPYIVKFTRTTKPKGWLADIHVEGTPLETYTLPSTDRPGQTIAERLVGHVVSGRDIGRHERPLLKLHNPFTEDAK